MRLVVIRHAIAEDREEFAGLRKDDALRPITRDGAREMERNVDGLRVAVPRIDRLASSRLVRARQTAAIVGAAYGLTEVPALDALAPEHPPDAILEWLRQLPDLDVVAIVGHEPHLGILVTWLLTGQQASCLVLKKGGACFLELDRLQPRAGRLRWLLTPSQLRHLRA